ncbi:MAG: hypothetical protein KUG77_02895 [Nannocystaceae bacterium]|nr:hypothetical protein [Nannocystaceae bacterium]
MTTDLRRATLCFFLCGGAGCGGSNDPSAQGTESESTTGDGGDTSEETGGDAQAAASTAGSQGGDSDATTAPSMGSDSSDAGSSTSTGVAETGGSESEGSGSGTDSEGIECDLDEGPLTFIHNIHPTFDKAGCNSLSCHNVAVGPSSGPELAHQFYVEGGWGGPATVIAGSSATSELIGYLEAFGEASPTTLTADDIDRVALWIDEGALLGDLPAPLCAIEDTFSFAADVAPIFAEAGCSVGGQCHGNGGFFPLIAHAGLVNVQSVLLPEWTYVVPGSVDESLLAWHMTEQHLPNDVLGKTEIAVVNRWIAGGALP